MYRGYSIGILRTYDAIGLVCYTTGFCINPFRSSCASPDQHGRQERLGVEWQLGIMRKSTPYNLPHPKACHTWYTARPVSLGSNRCLRLCELIKALGWLRETKCSAYSLDGRWSCSKGNMQLVEVTKEQAGVLGRKYHYPRSPVVVAELLGLPGTMGGWAD